MRNYTTNYYPREGRREEIDTPLHFSGPHRLGDMFVRIQRVGDEWKIAAREKRCHIFRRPNKPVALEDCTEKEGKFAELG